MVYLQKMANKNKKLGIKEIETETVYKYRYFCPACTGVAFYSVDKSEKLPVVCQNCGKSLEEIKPENFIKL